MGDGKGTVCYLNGLALHTINEVEKILLGVSKGAKRCGDERRSECSERKLQLLPSRGDVGVGSKKKKKEPRPLALSPEQPSQKHVKKATVLKLGDDPKKTSPSCRVLSDQIRVSPIVSCAGVILELDVEVTMPDGGAKKTLRLEIECPDFVPARIKIGNKWKNIQ